MGAMAGELKAFGPQFTVKRALDTGKTGEKRTPRLSPQRETGDHANKKGGTPAAFTCLILLAAFNR
jgi:hypothetical protein